MRSSRGKHEEVGRSSDPGADIPDAHQWICHRDEPGEWQQHEQLERGDCRECADDGGGSCESNCCSACSCEEGTLVWTGTKGLFIATSINVFCIVVNGLLDSL